MPLHSPNIRFVQQARSVEWVIAVYAVIFSVLFNTPFWSALFSRLEGWNASSVQVMLSVWLAITALHVIMLVLVSSRWILKPIMTALLLITAGATYFMSQYGIVIDTEMISNVFATDTREAQDLLTGKLVLYVVLLGGIPAWFLWRIPYRTSPWRRTLVMRGGMVLCAVLVFVGAVLLSYQGIASVARNHRELKSMVTPLNYVYGVANYFATNAVKSDGPRSAIGEDAKQRKQNAGSKPRLLVLVVGETARADHFSLSGYPQPTNAALSAIAAQDSRLIYFDNVWSCGTATAVSLPCMFSNLGRDNFNEREARLRETLVDVVQRAGIDVHWVNNNSGCKGICDRVSSIDVSTHPSNPLCSTGECFDEILIEQLAKKLNNISRDTLLVLHQKGSHGPAYFKRYPKSHERFKPVCENSQLDQCGVSTIVNAYDNTIAYTDYVLGELIVRLKKSEGKVESALLYLSDHGESLGEGGLFLHGMPYALAPDSQKHVPAVFWSGDGLSRSLGLSDKCLQEHRKNLLTHDYLFHTVLGLFDVQTAERLRELDFLAPCRAS